MAGKGAWVVENIQVFQCGRINGRDNPPKTPHYVAILGNILGTGAGEALLAGDLPHFQTADWRN